MELQVTGPVSVPGSRALIICHWFVIEFCRHRAVYGPGWGGAWPPICLALSCARLLQA
jgi:hypothetical protein